ncbi:MAG: NADH-quinone oxidoreductase subunit H, partial [Pirellulales bacterium]|nr:NADH-quinone oxidoreductase subunit H [Pirellulales bacterium]
MAEYLSSYMPLWLAALLWALVQSGLLLALVVTAAAVFTWMERKVSARIQDRLGPMRTGGRFGWLQSPADGIKLLCKEDLVPAAADKLLFRIAPYISFATCFGMFMALPWADGWVPVRMDAAVFFIMAVSGLEVFGVILAGYSSGSKWSLYGGMREAAQVISYEIPLGLCVIVPVLLAGTMDLVTIGKQQEGWCWNWFLFHDPFTFVTFWIYFTCAVAHTNRAPFDLPEADTELVAGFLTEYSGFRWTVFFMAEYGAMLAVCALASILFLGGWNGPIPIARLLGLTAEHGAVWGFLGNFLGFLNLLLKAFIGVTFMMALRWSLPRLRIDQVMTTCLKYCLPLASVMLAGVLAWCYFFPGGLWSGVFPSESAWWRETQERSEVKIQRSETETIPAVAQFPNPQSPIPNPQSPIPNPQSPIPN